MEVGLIFSPARKYAHADSDSTGAYDTLLTNGAYSYVYNNETGILTISVTNVTWKMDVIGSFYSNVANGSVTLSTKAYLFI